eukprot:g10296.t1
MARKSLRIQERREREVTNAAQDGDAREGSHHRTDVGDKSAEAPSPGATSRHEDGMSFAHAAELACLQVEKKKQEELLKKAREEAKKRAQKVNLERREQAELLKAARSEARMREEQVDAERETSRAQKREIEKLKAKLHEMQAEKRERNREMGGASSGTVAESNRYKWRAIDYKRAYKNYSQRSTADSREEMYRTPRDREIAELWKTIARMRERTDSMAQRGKARRIDPYFSNHREREDPDNDRRGGFEVADSQDISPLIGRKRSLDGSPVDGRGEYNPTPHHWTVDVGREQKRLQAKVARRCKDYRGQRSMEGLSKEDKKTVRTLVDELQHAEGKLIPVSLAFAVYRFDLGEVVKWSPILTAEAQRRYEEELRSTKARTKAKVDAITERVLDAMMLREGDDEAKTVIGEESATIDRWRNLVAQTAIPLVKRYWEPLVPGLSKKIEDWLNTIDREYVNVWAVAEKGVERVLWRYEQRVARGFAQSAENGAWQLLEFDLERELASEVARIRLEELDRIIIKQEPKFTRDVKGWGKEKSREWNRPEGAEKVRDAFREEMRKVYKDFEFTKEHLAKVVRHKDPNTRRAGCFFKCGGDLIATKRGLKKVNLCGSSTCTRSHDTKKVYPEGLKCLTGKCARSCKARSENVG